MLELFGIAKNLSLTLATPPPHRDFKVGGAAKLQKSPAVSLFHNPTCVSASARQKEHKNLSPKKKRKKTDNRREGWEDGTPPPHRDFKERSVVLAVAHPRASTTSYLYALRLFPHEG